MAETKSFNDGEGNTYRVERASNGKFVVMRHNAGGNRKLFKCVCPYTNKDAVFNTLKKIAEKKGWNPSCL